MTAVERVTFGVYGSAEKAALYLDVPALAARVDQVPSAAFAVEAIEQLRAGGVCGVLLVARLRGIPGGWA